MRTVICINGIRNDWYFDFSKDSFIYSNLCDLETGNFDFSGSDNEIPFYVSKIALQEFLCSLEWIVKNCKVIQVF